MKFEPIRDGLFSVGLFVMLAGVAQYSLPLALIVLGLALMALPVVAAIWIHDDHNNS